jgi:heme-degrading monooxygenase HmoA
MRNCFLSVAFIATLFTGTAAVAGPTSSSQEVILINPFEVKPGREQECLAMWEASRDFLSSKKGYISTKLHKALKPNAKFTYINVAVWASAEDFAAAVSDPKMRQSSLPEACTGNPALFQVIRD